MKHFTTLLMMSLISFSFVSESHAVLDDDLSLTAKARLHKAKTIRPTKKSIEKLATHRAAKQKADSAATIKRSLGAVPIHIQKNWNRLSQAQKEIIYSYHNENPYAEINKDAFTKASNRFYEHDTAFGFDSDQQVNLDALRDKINGATTEELSEEDKIVIENLAALED